MKFLVHFFAILTLSLISPGCSEKEISAPVHPVDKFNNGFESFAVAEIFAVNCTESGCHGGTEPKHGLSLESWDGLVKGSHGRDMGDSSHHNKINSAASGISIYGGGVIIPFNAEKSLLYNLITGNVQDHSLAMPYGRLPITESQIDIIRTWINNGARSFSGEIPYRSSDAKIFLCAQGSDEVYVIDPSHKTVSSIIDVDFNSNAPDQPHNVQLKNGYLYVTLISTGRFLKYDVSTLNLIGSMDGLEAPGMISISPDGKRAYISKSSTAPGEYNAIYVVNAETMSRDVNLSLPVFGLPHALALSSSGNKLYVANMTKDRISILNPITGDAEDEILLSPGGSLIHEPMHMYLSPDDQFLYVNCRKSSKMLIIETQSKSIISELLIHDHPMQAAVSNDGNKIYVVSHHHPYITEITKTGANNWIITKEFQSNSFHHLYGADLSPDGKYLYVTCSNSTNEFKARYQRHDQTRASLLCIYDTQSGELVKIIDTGSFATGIVSR